MDDTPALLGGPGAEDEEGTMTGRSKRWLGVTSVGLAALACSNELGGITPAGPDAAPSVGVGDAPPADLADADPSAGADAAPAARCAGGPVVALTPPAADLAGVVAAAAPGTCFALAAGTYTFHDVVPKDGMSFLGEATGAVVVDGRGHENAFHGTARDVTIARITLRGFDDAAGTSAQEQAPIRGTAGVWLSDPGRMAVGWVIDEVEASGNVASGIFVGDDFVVRRSHFHHNGVTGIGGDEFSGGLFEDNEVDHNGAAEATGASVNGGGIKVTQVDGAVRPLVIRGNDVHDNGRGIWCDVDCNGVVIEANRVHDNESTGIFYEVSRNAVIARNEVTNTNTWVTWTEDWNTGSIAIGESADVLIEGNTIVGGRSAITLRQTRRPSDGESYLAARTASGRFLNVVTRRVTVRGNVVRDSGSIGASHGPTGAGLLDYGSIVFADNTYVTPTSMAFWWNGASSSLSGWQAGGRQ